jgi:hypothetical protein
MSPEREALLWKDPLQVTVEDVRELLMIIDNLRYKLLLEDAE